MKSATLQTETANENRDIDWYFKQHKVVIATSENVLQKLHNGFMHLTTNFVSHQLREASLNMSQWGVKYSEIRLNYPQCRKAMILNNPEYTTIKPEQPKIEYCLDYAGPIYYTSFWQKKDTLVK